MHFLHTYIVMDTYTMLFIQKKRRKYYVKFTNCQKYTRRKITLGCQISVPPLVNFSIFSVRLLRPAYLIF